MACVPLVLAACGGERADDMIGSAKKYLEKNDNKAAIIQLKNSLQKSSDSAEARFLLGKAFFRNSDVVPASIELRKALEQIGRAHV